ANIGNSLGLVFSLAHATWKAGTLHHPKAIFTGIEDYLSHASSAVRRLFDFTLNVDGKSDIRARSGQGRHFRAVHWTIQGVALDGDAAGFADQALEFGTRGELGGLGAGVVVDFFFDDGAVEVVRAEA